MQDPNTSHLDLQATAKEIIQRYGFEPDFSAPVAAQLANLDRQPKSSPSRDIRDMRRYVVRRGLQVSVVVWSPFKSHPFFTTWGKD